MRISKAALDKAVQASIISERQAQQLMEFLKNITDEQPSFNMTNVLYYLGGLIAIGAMTLFMNMGWEKYGGLGLLFLSLIYSFLALFLSHIFSINNYKIPAGLCATFAIALTPLAIYGLELYLGLWNDQSLSYRNFHLSSHWNWIFMELGTLLIGTILAFFYRYPFMVMPIATTLWYFSMDVARLIVGENVDFQLSATISVIFGLATILLAFWVDMRSRNQIDYSFWFYFFGVLSFWGGLTVLHSESELSKFMYFLINLFMIGIGAILLRRVFVIFGALGVSVYLGYLASQVFKDSTLFPIALTVIGGIIIYFGTLWQKYELTITEKVQQQLPRPLREFLKIRHENN